MVEENNDVGIGMPEVKYIASCGKCPNCGSTSVRFKVPLESYLETKDGILNRVVLDFSSPQYWLKTTTTKCAYCGYEFHLRNHNEDFYKGLQETRQKEGTQPVKWFYDFDSYKTE
jgi:hypothetical protein